MRLSIIVIIVALVSATGHAPAQSVINVESEKAPPSDTQRKELPDLREAAPAPAQESPRPAAQGRYLLPEDRAELEAEIAQLKDNVASLKNFETEVIQLRAEVASLRREILALHEPPPPRPPADLTPPSDKGSDTAVKLPTQADIARAGIFIQDTWHRLVEMIVTVQKDMMRKG